MGLILGQIEKGISRQQIHELRRKMGIHSLGINGYHRRREIIKQHSLALVDIQIMKVGDSNDYTACGLNVLELSKNWDSKYILRFLYVYLKGNSTNIHLQRRSGK